jgi:hypothetical protein
MGLKMQMRLELLFFSFSSLYVLLTFFFTTIEPRTAMPATTMANLRNRDF